jgi:hypothetical protein
VATPLDDLLSCSREPDEADYEDVPTGSGRCLQATRHRRKTAAGLRHTYVLYMSDVCVPRFMRILSCTTPLLRLVDCRLPIPLHITICAFDGTTTSLWFRASRVPTHWHHPSHFSRSRQCSLHQWNSHSYHGLPKHYLPSPHHFFSTIHASCLLNSSDL